MYSLAIHLHKHQLYLLKPHSESFQMFRIYTEGKSFVMKLDPGFVCLY